MLHPRVLNDFFTPGYVEDIIIELSFKETNNGRDYEDHEEKRNRRCHGHSRCR